MKLSSIVSFSLVLLLADFSSGAATTKAAATTKTTEKLSYPKKVSSLKKRPSKNSLKKEADITEKFKDLPADDLAFIKELDKQFKLHGGKVKIKVENENATESKNSKRTIEGELGYGYSHNGYDYNPPKFMFYPYSQQNIENNAPKYFVPEEEKTQVSVEPSYSYELKPQTYITHNEPQLDVPQPEVDTQQQQHHYHQQQQPQHYDEPVIVLRIPGPAKYASHLQTLLQQYLEIRAAQYLRILEEAELRKQQQHQHHQLDYGHAEAAAAGGGGQNVEQESHHQVAAQHDYQQQVEYDHQVAVTPQPIQYPEIDNVYHSYKHRHSSHPEQAQQPHDEQQPQQAYYTQQQQDEQEQQQHQQHQQQHIQHQYQPEYQHQPEQEPPQFYYTHQQEYAQPEGPPANTYQHLYLVSMSQQSPHGYEGAPNPQNSVPQQQPIYVHDHQQEAHHDHSSTLPITENNPGPSHTKVLFTPNSEHASADYQSYQLPSIKPNERHAPTSVPDYHQDFQPQEYQHVQHGQQESQESAHNYQQHAGTVESVQPDVVAITQRPFNYHAKASVRGRTGHRRRASSLKQADQGLQKIHEYITDKLGAQTGSAVEYKTTQVIEG